MLALCCAVIGLAVGCNPKKHYKLLSFFFDGVPDPNAPARSTARAGRNTADKPERPVIFSTHKPFEEENCKACHKGDPTDIKSLLTTTDSTICMDCHQPLVQKFPVMHGPVAAKACLWCHAPHTSSEPLLLRAATPDLCMQCHDRQLLGDKPPDHQDAKADCLSCHFGHGADKRFFLKPVPTTAPASPPIPTTQPVAIQAEVRP